MVGTSDKTAVRLSVVTASARTWPLLRNPMTPDVVANIIWSEPAMTSWSAWSATPMSAKDGAWQRLRTQERQAGRRRLGHEDLYL